MAQSVISCKQLSAMGIHYHYYSLSYMLQAQAKAGYQSIELFCAAPHVAMTAEGIGDRDALIHTLRKSGLNVACVTPDNCMGPWQYAASDPDTIAQSKRYFRHALELASDLDCPLVACHSGWGLLDQPREEAWDRSLSFTDWYCQQAKSLGITLVMESLRPEESNLVNTLSSLKAYLSQLGHSNIKPMIDTCAMAVAGETIDAWFEEFGNEIAHMHFVDGTPYGHLAWGDGDRCLEHYMDVIAANHYQGALTFELTDGRYFRAPENADRQCMEMLRPYFNS